MKRLKMIYAVALAVIYVTATALSSLAVLTCNHPHHAHASEHYEHSCCGESHAHIAYDIDVVAFNAECCDHDHSLLGENHTEFIVEKRGDDAMPLLYALDMPATLVAESTSLNPILPINVEPYRGYEQLPLRAAFSRYDSLRAPPSLA